MTNSQNFDAGRMAETTGTGEREESIQAAGLKLMKSFLQIEDAAKREFIIELTERIARASAEGR